MANEIITTREVAEILKVPKRTLSRWVKKGMFLKPERDYRGYYFWSREELLDFLENRWVTPLTFSAANKGIL